MSRGPKRLPAKSPAPPPPTQDEERLFTFRQWLAEADHKAHSDYDRTVLSLSGASLGVSFVFLKDVVGPDQVEAAGLLLSAWACWTASSVAVLFSFAASSRALRRQIQMLDASLSGSEPPPARWPRLWSVLTRITNMTSGSLFAIGVGFMATFVYQNLTT